jgi:hypothetical protein
MRMFTKFKYLLSFAILFSLSSCEKVIEVDLNDADKQIVIEGNITDVTGPQVIKITQSVPYTDSNIYPGIDSATVIVNDDAGHTWKFNRTEPGVYTIPSLRGLPGRTYNLTATINKVIYTASSKMPEPVLIDSLSIKSITFGGEERKQVEVIYNDPKETVNQYRFVLKINGVLTKRIFTDNDRFTNGNKVRSTLFYSDDDNKELASGDRIEVEIQGVDNDVFTYWNTLSQQTQNGPGGGVTPGNPPSNIKSNALGYFSAHTTMSKTTVLQ